MYFLQLSSSTTIITQWFNWHCKGSTTSVQMHLRVHSNRLNTDQTLTTVKAGPAATHQNLERLNWRPTPAPPDHSTHTHHQLLQRYCSLFAVGIFILSACTSFTFNKLCARPHDIPHPARCGPSPGSGSLWLWLWRCPYKVCSDLNSQPKRPGDLDLLTLKWCPSYVC